SCLVESRTWQLWCLYLFGTSLQRYRVAAGYSREALAERAGLSRRGIADLELGARRTAFPGAAAGPSARYRVPYRWLSQSITATVLPGFSPRPARPDAR